MARSISFFWHCFSLSIYLLPNVDLRLEYNKCISCLLFNAQLSISLKEKESYRQYLPSQDRTSFQHCYEIELLSILPFNKHTLGSYYRHGNVEIFKISFLFLRIFLRMEKISMYKYNGVCKKMVYTCCHGSMLLSTYFCDMFKSVLNS